MRILIACEFSGTVREAFAAKGHDAWSCDFDGTERRGKHLRCNVLTVLNDGWDMMIAHPPCTHLCISGARWFPEKNSEQYLALKFVEKLWNANIPKIALENPVSILSTELRKPDQIIQPWQFGHEEKKATCLWLKNLPKLIPTNIVSLREAKVHKEPPSVFRAKNRSRTYQGFATAMADQWS